MRRSPPPRRGRSPSPYGRRRSPSFRRGRSPRWISKCFHHIKPVGSYKFFFLLIYHHWQYLNLALFPPAPEGTDDLQVPAGEGVQAPDTGDKYTILSLASFIDAHIQEESLATLQEALPLAQEGRLQEIERPPLLWTFPTRSNLWNISNVEKLKVGEH